MCISIGVDIDTFWTYDFDDLTLLLEGYELKQKNDARYQYKQAQLTALFICSALGGKPPTLYQAFPGLFDEEEKEYNTLKAEEQMMQYAKLWNAKRARQEEELNG